MRLYHFVEPQYGVEDIVKQRLKVCRFFDLNDPFELLMGNLGNKDVRTKVKGWARKLNEKHGLLCFAMNWDNSVMWSHYAQRHKGMCLGFDVNSSRVRTVEYRHERMSLAKWKSVNAAEVPEDLKDNLLVGKYDHWEYENERRMILPLGSLMQEGRLFFRPFDHTLKLVEIVTGHRCCVKWKPLIECAVKALPSKPKLIKARLAFKGFKVVTQQFGFENPGGWEQCGDTCSKNHDSRNGAPHKSW